MRTVLGLVLLLVAAPAAAAPRDDALAALADRGDVEARRRAAITLAEAGTMADAPALLAALRDPDARVRLLAERALWEVWSRSGSDEIDELLRAGIAEMQHGQLEASIDTFSEVIRRRPDFAEGWNKRATVYYLAGEYRKSIADCAEVLKRNPRHFGALSGLGLIYMRLERYDDALAWSRKALEVNPNMLGVEFNIKHLERLLAEKRGKQI